MCEARGSIRIEISHKTYAYPLLMDIHRSLSPPTTAIGEIFYTRGNFLYFHYNCDGVNDIGWGCGYRTLQTAISWIINKKCCAGGGNGDESPQTIQVNDVPSIKEVQEILVSIDDKPESFVGSRNWIGTLEEFYTIDVLFALPCKILHGQLTSNDVIEKIRQYFIDYCGFIMMGGFNDTASKGIAGIHLSGDGVFLLIVDPHFTGIPNSVQELITNGNIRWMHITELDNSSYNLCMPLLK